MNTPIKLTDTQRQVLEHAVDQPGGCINWFPENVKGGAKQKVLDGLFNRALITRNATDWFVAAEGYDALGRARPGMATVHPDPEIEAAVTAHEATWVQEKQEATEPLPMPVAESKPTRIRENSKQATVLAMLQRPEGATIRQICEVTTWQAHTTRGFFAGALKKKLGLTITSEKPEGGERAYRVQA